MKLRTAAIGDAAALAAVHAEAFDQPWPAGALAALLEGPGHFALLAESELAPAAFVMMRALAGEAEVLTLACAPPCRRRGVARALMEAALARAGDLGAEVCFLEVAADNPAAMALYRSLGFEAVGRRAGYYARTGRPAADALVLRRALNSPRA